MAKRNIIMKKCIAKILVVGVVALALLFAACDPTQTLVSASGAEVTGNLPQDAVFIAHQIDEESPEYATAISALDEQTYDLSSPVYVWDLHLEQNGQTVQPSGKVKVSLPFEGEIENHDLLHLTDGKVKVLSVKAQSGKLIFETDGFSPFVLAKRAKTPNVDPDPKPAQTYTFSAVAKSIVQHGQNNGGYVLNTSEENITGEELSLTKDSQYTATAHCNNSYYFLGWYEASTLEQVSQQTLISKEATQTFTISENLNVVALFAREDDVVEVKLNARHAEFSYQNDQPVKTVVAIAAGENERPDPDKVSTTAVFANGNESLNSTEILCDKGGLDFGKAGTYTISYYSKNCPLIKAELVVEVVDSADCYDLSVYSELYNFQYNYNGWAEYDDATNKYTYESKRAAGSLVTLSAITEKYEYTRFAYKFDGWFVDGKLVSTEYVYNFEMPSRPTTIVAKWTSAGTLFATIKVKSGIGGTIVDSWGNKFIGSVESWEKTTTIYYSYDSIVSFRAQAGVGYDFVGWYSVTNYSETLLSTDEILNYTVEGNRIIMPKFEVRLSSFETPNNGDVIDGTVYCAVGDTKLPDYQHYELTAKSLNGLSKTISADAYDVSGEVDFTKAGTYTVTYSYKKDASVTTSLNIVVIDPQNLQVVYENSCSHLEHEYNGKAVFVSRKDVTVNGLPLEYFKNDSAIWNTVSYKWIDKSTGNQVDTTDADVTINGVVTERFGPDGETVGNEFCGPIEAGEYKFELSVNGTVAFTAEAKITTNTFKKITTAEEFKTNEGSTWVNFELYYYTIVAEVDGNFYVMQMPSIGSEATETEARLVTPDGNGNLILGDERDFVFVNAKYYANYTDNYTEFLTGYYGSYVIRSSGNSTDGLFGSPYIYRTGYTCVSGGIICREYGTKYPYGNKTEFADNGAVTIYCPRNYETANDRLRLVYDGEKYLFTSAPADTDTRTSYEVFIYQSNPSFD